MHILEKETILKINEALASSYYKKWVHFFEKVLRTTRDKRYRSNRKELLAIQLRLAKIETELWGLLREGRKRAKALRKLETGRMLTVKEAKTLKDYEKHIFINEQLIRISRTICDGMAWRFLNYDRAFLSTSARGFGAGEVDVNSNGFKSELEWACRISETFDSVVILNDLTRFFRVGDLTEIGSGGVFVHEVKHDKGRNEIKNIFTINRKLKNGKNHLLSNQEKRLFELQCMAITNDIIIKGNVVRTKNLTTKFRTNFYKFRRLLRRSAKEFVVSERIEPCVILRIINFEAISSKGKESDFEILKPKLEAIASSGILLPHSNWDTFYSDESQNFLRALAPYSIFPLSAKDCMRLISGYYFVECFLDVEKLKEILQLHNWNVETVTEKELDQQLSAYERVEKTIFSVRGLLYDSIPDEVGLLKIRRGAFFFNLTPSFYNRLTMEFMSLKTLLDLLEEMYSKAAEKQKGDTYFPILSGESKTWN